MLLQRSLSILCAFFALAVASPAPVSPSGPAKWLLSHSQRLPLAEKHHLSLLNTRFRRIPAGNIFKALHKRNVSPGPLGVTRIHSLDALRQAHDTARRTHEIGPRDPTMTRPETAILAGRLADHHSIQSKTASQIKFSGRNSAPITRSLLQNTRMLKSKLGQYVGRKAAPLGTSKVLAGLFRTSLPIANRIGLTGEICTSSSECADGRICTNGEITTCPVGETCFCVPSDGPERCTSSADCSTAGEVCVQINELTVCFSEETANTADIPIVDAESSDDPVETPASNSTEPDGESGDGITGAICTSSSECADGRICINADVDTCPVGETCLCVPSDGPEPCTSSPDCSTAGEVCVQLSESTVCFSEETANAADIPIVDAESSDDPVESPASNSTDPDGGSGDGITGTICTTSSECADGRICVGGSTSTCPAGETCFCVPADGFETCTSSADCSTAGEVCVQLTGSTVCLSEEFAKKVGIPIADSSVDPEESPASNSTDPDGGSDDGITGTICTTSSECADGRICVEGSTSTCPAGETCFCAPADGFETCTSSADCLTAGEVCIQLPERSVCFSEETATAADILIVDDESSGTPEETPANEDTDSHDSSGDGITGSTCTCSSGCTGGRFCTNGNMITCPAGDSCICMPLGGMKVCSSSAECLTGGEVCVRVISLTLCLSEEVAIAEGIPILDGVSS